MKGWVPASARTGSVDGMGGIRRSREMKMGPRLREDTGGMDEDGPPPARLDGKNWDRGNGRWTKMGPTLREDIKGEGICRCGTGYFHSNDMLRWGRRS